MRRGIGRGTRWSASLVAAVLILLVAQPSSSAAAPEVVAGGTAGAGGRCGAETGSGVESRSVPADEASFDGDSPLLTLAAGDPGGLYVGDTVAVRKIEDGRVTTVLGRTSPSSPSAGSGTSPVGRAPDEVDVIVSGLAVDGEELYFVNRGGTTASPTIQVLSVDLADADPRIGARSAAVPGGEGPHGLAVDDTGVVYVTDAPAGGAGRLGRLRAGTAIDWLPLGAPVESVAVEADGSRAYVAGAADHVQEVDYTSSPPRVTAVGPVLTSGRSKRVALDRSQGVLFVADSGAGTIGQIELGPPLEARPLAGDGGPDPAVPVAGMGFGRETGRAAGRLFVLDPVACAVLALAPLPAGAGLTTTPPTAPVASGGEDRQANQPADPGGKASETDSAAGASNLDPQGSPSSLADTGGRLTADDLVNQLLGGRSDGAFGGSQVITDPDPALLAAPGGRAEAILGGDLSGAAVEQAVGVGVTPPLPPPLVPGPGPEAFVSSAAAAPPPLSAPPQPAVAPLPAPPQPAGAPLPGSAPVNPAPGWGGASAEQAEGAPRYAMVSQGEGGRDAAVVLVSLLVVGGCALGLALGAAGRGGPHGQPAPARAWAR